MTVAAVILSATTEGALAPIAGQSRVRHLADLAWSGGALPIVVLAPDPDGTVATSLAGSEAVGSGPAPSSEGPRGQMVRGVEVALETVRDVSGVLLWPARLTWVGPETITSLIERHGLRPDRLLRPAWHGDPGWPILLPVAGGFDALRGLDASLDPPAIAERLAAALRTEVLELGDPGVVLDVDTPRDALPPYEGPPQPRHGGGIDWGSDVEAEAGLPGPAEG